MKCTYVLPDGITHTKGYVKNLDEAQRYLSLLDGTSNPTTELDCKRESGQGGTDKAEDRMKVDMIQNVTPKLHQKK